MCIRLTIILCFIASGRSSFNVTESGHAGSSFTEGAPIPSKVTEILGAVGFASRYSTQRVDFRMANPKEMPSDKILGDFDFNEVVIKLDTQIQKVCLVFVDQELQCRFRA